MNSIYANYKNDASVDYSKIEELRKLGQDIGEDVVPQLIALHFETSESILLELHSGAKSLEFMKLKSSVHKLKSSCGTLGLIKLHKLCDDFEKYLGNKPEAFLVITYVDCIQFEYEKTRSELSRFGHMKVGA